MHDQSDSSCFHLQLHCLYFLVSWGLSECPLPRSRIWPNVPDVEWLTLVFRSLPRRTFCMSSSFSGPLSPPDPSVSPGYPDDFLFLALSLALPEEFYLDEFHEVTEHHEYLSQSSENILSTSYFGRGLVWSGIYRSLGKPAEDLGKTVMKPCMLQPRGEPDGGFRSGFCNSPALGPGPRGQSWEEKQDGTDGGKGATIKDFDTRNPSLLFILSLDPSVFT